MALKSTICKVDLAVADMDRNVYENFSLRLAQHPSENEARMMIRLLAFMMYANERLEFGKGLSTDDRAKIKSSHGYAARETSSGNFIQNPSGVTCVACASSAARRFDVCSPTSMRVVNRSSQSGNLPSNQRSKGLSRPKSMWA